MEIPRAAAKKEIVAGQPCKIVECNLESKSTDRAFNSTHTA
jgi:hypothetical protein